jgi:hypothetical protein
VDLIRFSYRERINETTFSLLIVYFKFWINFGHPHPAGIHRQRRRKSREDMDGNSKLIKNRKGNNAKEYRTSPGWNIKPDFAE